MPPKATPAVHPITSIIMNGKLNPIVIGAHTNIPMTPRIKAMPHKAPTRKKAFLAPYFSANLPTKYVNATAATVAIIIKIMKYPHLQFGVHQSPAESYMLQ